MEKKTKRTLIAAVAAFLAAFALIAVLCPAQAAIVDITPQETPSIVLPAEPDPVKPLTYISKSEKSILLGVRKDGSYVVGRVIGGRMAAIVCKEAAK